MIKKPDRAAARVKRHYRIRNHISGTPRAPRLAVFRSNKHIYVQLIDDVAQKTLAASSTKEKAVAGGLKSTSNIEAAQAVGRDIAKKAIAAGVTAVVFDRGGYIYHGKVKALAEAAREGGLKF